MAIFAEFCGWGGAVLVLSGYYLVSAGKINGNALNFQIMNICGASLIIIYTISRHAYANTVINLIWVVIGLTTLLKQKRIEKLSKINNQIDNIMGSAAKS